MNQSPAPPVKSSTMEATAAIRTTADTPLAMAISESRAATTLEMTSRIRATLERRSTMMPSTIVMIDQTTMPRLTATSTPTTAFASMLASMLASWNSGTRSIVVTTWSRATRSATQVRPKSSAAIAENTIAIQAAAVTVPGRRSPVGCGAPYTGCSP